MKKLKIIYEDKDIIIVLKESKLLTISNDKEKDKTLYRMVSSYLKKKNKNNKIFVVHRLDYDTSGLVMFAKNEKVKQILQNNWNNNVNRYYMAIVLGNVKKDKDVIKSYMNETRTNLCYSSVSGKLAITEYKKIVHNNRYSLLEIRILTGRKNQIRVHMKDIGHLIVGDKKYGCSDNSLGRLGLFAYKLEFVHPVNREKMLFEMNVPIDFVKLMKLEEK